MLMRLRTAPSFLGLLMMAGCGGSGHGGDVGPPLSVVGVGGTVTGLVGKVVLQNNAGDNLSVTTNGSFTFDTPLNKGSAYAITILTQPSGSTCAVSNGSGTATGNVTSVSVTCSTDPSTMYLPIIATPAASGAGSTGLFVITSKSPGDAPIQITTDSTVSLGVQSPYTLGAQGAAKSGNPSVIVYTTRNSAKGDHVWSLDLSAKSTLVPTQLSDLTIPYPTATNGRDAALCSGLFLKNLTDPASGFLILAMPTEATTSCFSVGASLNWVLIHSTDGPTTDPTPLPALQIDSILPLYRPDGALAGILAIDTSNNLNFYPDETFTHPVLLLASVSHFASIQDPPAGLVGRISANPTYSYLLVTPLNPGGSQSIYRIDYSGSLSPDLYDSPLISNYFVDSGNLYFTTYARDSLGFPATFVNRITGAGVPQVLGSVRSNALELPTDLVGVSGSEVLTSQQLTPYTPPFATTELKAFATDASGTSRVIADIDFGHALLAGGSLFATKASSANAHGVSTQILDLAGNVLQPEIPASEFIYAGTQVIQLRSLTNLTTAVFTPNLGGGQVYIYDPTHPTSPTAGPLKLADGTTFSLPSGTSNVYLQPLTAILGIGNTYQSGTLADLLLTYNLTTGIITPISLPNSNLQFVLDDNLQFIQN
jgi:hypothetical protein